MKPTFAPFAAEKAHAMAAAVVADASPDAFPLPPETPPVAELPDIGELIRDEWLAELQDELVPPLPESGRPDLDDMPSDDSATVNLSDLLPETAAADILPEEEDDHAPGFVGELLEMV